MELLHLNTTSLTMVKSTISLLCMRNRQLIKMEQMSDTYFHYFTIPRRLQLDLKYSNLLLCFRKTYHMNAFQFKKGDASSSSSGYTECEGKSRNSVCWHYQL